MSLALTPCQGVLPCVARCRPTASGCQPGGRNVPLGLAHVHGPALEMAERSGLLPTVGTDRVFPTTPAVVAWAQSVADAPAPGLGR
jgi:hypothetical protein